MKIVERTVGDVTVLDLKDKMTRGNNPGKLREKVLQLFAAGRLKVLINLEESRVMDDEGFGEVILTYRKVQAAKGARLGFFGLSATIEDLFSRTKIKTTIPVFNDEAEGLKEFGDETQQ